MKSSEMKFFMFVASLIIGILLSGSLSINNGEKKISLEEYQEVYEKRTKLLTEISKLEKEKKILEEKISEYDKDKSDDEKIKILEKDLENNKNLLGLTDIEGEGVIITLEDGEEQKGQEIDSFIRRQRTIHDNDVNELLNDIKGAGAQAISINDERIIYNTSVYCAGQFLKIDKNIKTPAPFEIKIIGEKERLEAELLSDQSTLERLKNRGIKINFKTVDNIKIKAL